jgi:hypothetical protein
MKGNFVLLNLIRMKHVVNAYVAVLATTSAFAAGLSLAPLDSETETVIRQGRPKTTVIVTNPLVATLPEEEEEKKRFKAPVNSLKKRQRTYSMPDYLSTGGRSRKKQSKPKGRSRR